MLSDAPSPQAAQSLAFIIQARVSWVRTRISKPGGAARKWLVIHAFLFDLLLIWCHLTMLLGVTVLLEMRCRTQILNVV